MRAAFVGECMVELRHEGAERLRMGFAGDVFNAAAFLVRSAPAGLIDVQFVTVTGDDPYSAAMRATWRDHGVGDCLTTTLPGGKPGLYLIRLDDKGERSFLHYRGESAARGLFSTDQPAFVDQAIVDCDLVYLSAITLSILTPAARERLLGVLAAARRSGAQIVLDTNYRPAGWPDAARAAAALSRVVPLASVMLPTLADDQAIFGDADAQACVTRLRTAGVDEIVVKLGADGCLVAGRAGLAQHVPAVPDVEVIDTTAAGDAFNGAYLAARLAGADPVTAAKAGHVLAAQVIAVPGALLPPAKQDA